MVEKYPETLITKDKWGDIPLLYALWCNAPADIIQLLVESYKANHSGYEFDWIGMFMTLAKGRADLANVQKLVIMQQDNFPDQHYNMETVVMNLAAQDNNQYQFHLRTPHETFRYLLKVGIAKRLDSLNIRRCREELEDGINEFPEYPLSKKEERARGLYSKLALYETIKESTSVLELALWKAKIDDSRNRRARVDNDVSYRDKCRIKCGADIVIRNVLPYLFPK